MHLLYKTKFRVKQVKNKNLIFNFKLFSKIYPFNHMKSLGKYTWPWKGT
jgi:hypothetical protein